MLWLMSTYGKKKIDIRIKLTEKVIADLKTGTK